MLGLWLTLIGITVLYLICTAFFIHYVKIPLNTYDAYKVDPVPDTIVENVENGDK